MADVSEIFKAKSITCVAIREVINDRRMPWPSHKMIVINAMTRGALKAPPYRAHYVLTSYLHIRELHTGYSEDNNRRGIVNEVS